MRKVRGKLKNFTAECRTAGLGIMLAFRQKHYVAAVAISFVVFGTLMSLLSSSTAGFNLLFMGEIGGFLNYLFKAFLGLFGVGRTFTDWALVFFVSLLQAVVIGLVALVWKRRKDKAKMAASRSENAENVQKAGIAAGLAILGSGCPTCGTTLLMPVITAVVGGGGMALASAVSKILTVLAIFVLLFSMKSLGCEAYTLIIEKELTRKEKNGR